MYTHPFFEATPPGATPGPRVNTGARVRHFRGCNKYYLLSSPIIDLLSSYIIDAVFLLALESLAKCPLLFPESTVISPFFLPCSLLLLAPLPLFHSHFFFFGAGLRVNAPGAKGPALLTASVGSTVLKADLAVAFAADLVGKQVKRQPALPATTPPLFFLASARFSLPGSRVGRRPAPLTARSLSTAIAIVISPKSGRAGRLAPRLSPRPHPSVRRRASAGRHASAVLRSPGWPLPSPPSFLLLNPYSPCLSR